MSGDPSPEEPAIKTFSKHPQEQEILEKALCPICGHDQARNHWDCGSFSFKRCPRCGHRYQDPRPRADDLVNRYDDEYRDYEIENSGNFFGLMLKGMEDVGFSALEGELTAKAAEEDRRPRFLDIGCATGTLVEAMKHRGWDARGLEVCLPAAIYGRERRKVTIDTGYLHEQDYPSHLFDCIHSSHVIEHVPEPGDFLREQCRIMRPGAYLLVTTPNTTSLQALVHRHHWRSAIADHVHLFSRRNLRRLLIKAGLEPLRWKTWGGLPLGMGPRWLKGPMDRAAKALGFGDVMIFLAQKPL